MNGPTRMTDLSVWPASIPGRRRVSSSPKGGSREKTRVSEISAWMTNNQNCLNTMNKIRLIFHAVILTLLKVMRNNNGSITGINTSSGKAWYPREASTVGGLSTNTPSPQKIIEAMDALGNKGLTCLVEARCRGIHINSCCPLSTESSAVNTKLTIHFPFSL